MIKLDALIFDLDGTLVDSRRDLARSVQFLQEHYGTPKSTQAEVATFIGDGVVKLVQRALPNIPDTQLEQAVVTFKKFYRDHCLDHTHLYPGVRKMLDYFKQKPMAVVTNKPVRVSGYMLDSMGLSHYFKIVIGGDSLPEKKPHPEPIRNALRSLGVLPSRRVLVVGDSSNDIVSGRAARVRTCGIKSNIGDIKKLLISKPDIVISRMAELARIFN